MRFDGLGLGIIRPATDFVRFHLAAILTMSTPAGATQLAAKSAEQIATTSIVTREQSVTMSVTAQATEEVPVIAEAIVLQAKDAAAASVATTGVAAG
ncbi:MAG: hypothetical protein Q8M16_08995 [Pirellulaceae bacterium]|nr:hypothetical protein [Pirellulaceae bacterium]